MAVPRIAKFLLFIQLAIDLSAALSLFLDPHNALIGPPMNWFTQIFNLPAPPKSPLSATDMQLITVIAVLSLAHATNYALSLVYGMDEIIYLSVPQRLIFAVVAGAFWYQDPQRGSASMVLICGWDPLSAIVMGFIIGSFTGKPPRPRKGLDSSKIRVERNVVSKSSGSNGGGNKKKGKKH